MRLNNHDHDHNHKVLLNKAIERPQPQTEGLPRQSEKATTTINKKREKGGDKKGLPPTSMAEVGD